MCGILGKVTLRGRHEDGEVFAAALSEIGHRGPDDCGVFHATASGEARVSLGHARLSILDVSEAGHQPMTSPRTGSVIVYNGEVYNFPDVRGELEARGLGFVSQSDTEAVLAAYDEFGERFVDRLNGMFAVAIWDQARRRLVLARDRLGIKPLYYYWDGRQLAFASEVTALAALPTLELAIDQDALRQYLLHGYIPFPFSIFEKVHKLPAGHLLQLDLEHPEPIETSYWDAVDYYATPAPFKSEGEVLAALREELSQAVRRQLISDVPLGSFLSGGIDSSLVVALMRQVHTGPVRTFTIGFSEPEWDEAPMAKRISEHLGTEHEEFYLSEGNVLEFAHRAADYYDEPFADPAAIPTLALSQLTRRHVTVALSGDGGDELFWGYVNYKLVRSLWLLYGVCPYWLRMGLASCLRLIPGEAYRRKSRACGFKDLLAFQLQPRKWNPGIAYSRLHRHCTQVDRALEIGREVVSRLGHRSWPAQTGAIDVKCALVDQMLTKIDRASMSVALETRVPILDHRVVELAARIPSRFKTAGGELKHLLRALLGELIPRSLWDRPKSGFRVPLERWFRTVLKEWAYDELTSRNGRLRDWLDQNELRAMLDDHVAGRRNVAGLIWSCLQLAGWERRVSRIRARVA